MCVLNELYIINCNNKIILNADFVLYVGIRAQCHVKAAPEGEEPPTRKEEKGEKMQANTSYLPIEMSYKSQEQQYICECQVSSTSSD